MKSILVPDVGNSASVEVIEVNVKVGDTVAVNDTLVTLEGDKASMEIPSTAAGVVKEIKLKVGDKVKQGAEIVVLDAADGSEKVAASAAPEKSVTEKAAVMPTAQVLVAPVMQSEPHHIGEGVYASPAVRRLARELGIDLNIVGGSGRKGRIQKTDLHQFVQRALSSGETPSGTGAGLPRMPEVDFTVFGDIEFKPMARIRKLSAANLHRNWVNIPHVTQFDEADITDLEEFRNSQKKQAQAQGFKLTPLVFLMKAVVAALKQYPEFNASLSPDGEQLILKKYYHIGVAVDTPQGLVVPVIRSVDQKGLFDLAKELGEVSERAREGKLTSKEMQGSCFTISSLGGIGGTAFTPIINAPDVAILGVSRSQMKPVYQEGAFVPRLMLPLSLSYDHRVIDGAQAANFITALSSLLGDLRRVLL